MMEKVSTELMMLLIPLLVIEVGSVVFCGVKIFKEGVANLNKWAWLGIVAAANVLGAALFLTMGRRRDLA